MPLRQPSSDESSSVKPAGLPDGAVALSSVMQCPMCRHLESLHHDSCWARTYLGYWTSPYGRWMIDLARLTAQTGSAPGGTK